MKNIAPCGSISPANLPMSGMSADGTNIEPPSDTGLSAQHQHRRREKSHRECQ